MRLRALTLFVSLCVPLAAQQRVSLFNRYERVMAIVPMTGAGTLDDPMRPLYAPAPKDMNPSASTGILAFTFVTSDDGNLALVEFVARDRAAFQQILADTSITVFLKGRDKRADAQAAFAQYKKNFNFGTFGAVLP
jgi:hypothetical protein